jgi:YidC/Oxa1 family membrane protein insertase
MRLARIALVVLLLPLVAGCFGPGGVPLSDPSRESLAEALEEIDRLQGEAQIRARIDSFEEELEPVADIKDPKFQDKAVRLRLLIGYCWESAGKYEEALSWYKQVTRSQYDSVAYLRIADVAEYLASQPGADKAGWRKEAQGALERAAGFRVQADPATGRLRGPYVLMRVPPVGRATTVIWERNRDLVREARERLDGYYRERLIYRIFEFLVRISWWAGKDGAYIMAIVLLAALAKLITTPLSASQFRSMKAMQQLQPEIKKLQEKLKGDKQQLARAQMELFKEAKVSPFSSCLPMLIQMPILIWVYYGIRYFIYRFEGVHFLYLQSLADPDVLLVMGRSLPGPLLLLYGVSMYFSQKLIATPAATPEQQQQQKMMAYLMPVMFVLLLNSLPAAFILYWFLQNILMTGHQYLMMRAPLAKAAEGATAGPRAERPKPAGPPPEAMAKLSQGTRRPGKKRKK